jgi:hypothetical protein
MPSVNVSIDAADHRVFENEHWAWQKSLPREPGALGYFGALPAMSGPSLDGRCNYMSVSDEFLEVLKTKGVSFRVLP